MEIPVLVESWKKTVISGVPKKIFAYINTYITSRDGSSDFHVYRMAFLFSLCIFKSLILPLFCTLDVPTKMVIRVSISM